MTLPSRHRTNPRSSNFLARFLPLHQGPRPLVWWASHTCNLSWRVTCHTGWRKVTELSLEVWLRGGNCMGGGGTTNMELPDIYLNKAIFYPLRTGQELFVFINSPWTLCLHEHKTTEKYYVICIEISKEINGVTFVNILAKLGQDVYMNIKPRKILRHLFCNIKAGVL